MKLGRAPAMIMSLMIFIVPDWKLKPRTPAGRRDAISATGSRKQGARSSAATRNDGARAGYRRKRTCDLGELRYLAASTRFRGRKRKSSRGGGGSDRPPRVLGVNDVFDVRDDILQCALDFFVGRLGPVTGLQ